MLNQLTIKNYALIKELDVDFHKGFSVITGETGAGKSILLGALGLVLGKRADSSFLRDTEKKCVIEATFDLANFGLESFFEVSDLDFEQQTIIRREILPSSKSRAFVNDSPVTLNVLAALGEKLVDIHSQHQTLSLSSSDFQFHIIDSLSKNQAKLASYKKGLKLYNKAKKELDELIALSENSKQSYEYDLHLFNELNEAQLQEGEQESIEEELELLNNSEAIKLNLSTAVGIINQEELGLLDAFNKLKSSLSEISSYSQEYEELYQRIASCSIEINDIASEIENKLESVDYQPETIQKLNDRLQLIYALQKKHTVDSIADLLIIQNQLDEKVGAVENSSELIEAKKQEVNKIAQDLDKVATMLHDAREEVIPKFIKELEGYLGQLGMSNATFDIQLLPQENFLSNGKDQISFLFSANKGGSFNEIKKTASGGEMSRIMFATKLILSKYVQLPTIIFDEIDTGVSGEVADKMGIMMQNMGENMQVLSITHLPQIASKGKSHYKVYKEVVGAETNTDLKELETQSRVEEIAEMLSGKILSESALAHAKELLSLGN